MPDQPTPRPIHVGHAKARAWVRLADGRTGQLTYWPLPHHLWRPKRPGQTRRGDNATVRLPNGHHVSVPPTLLTLVPQAERTAEGSPR